MVWRWLLSVALGCILVVGPLRAQDRTELRAAIERIQTHRRVALGYLQTGNADLALVEMERLLDLLSPESTARPWVEPTLVAAVAGARASVQQGIEAAEDGDLDRAGGLMAEAIESLDSWRQDAGLHLFSDCIARASSIYEGLDTHRMKRPDLSDPSVRRRISEAAAATGAALARCDAEASPDIRAEPEFRRLVDGFAASLKLVPEAADRRDADYLHRLLIEQRAFERLLAFRYG